MKPQEGKHETLKQDMKCVHGRLCGRPVTFQKCAHDRLCGRSVTLKRHAHDRLFGRSVVSDVFNMVVKKVLPCHHSWLKAHRPLAQTLSPLSCGTVQQGVSLGASARARKRIVLILWKNNPKTRKTQNHCKHDFSIGH